MFMGRRQVDDPKPNTLARRLARAKRREMIAALGLQPPKVKPRTSAQRSRKFRARLVAAEEDRKRAKSRERRAASRAAPPVAPEFRYGDARQVLTDIADESVALVVTDPPWADEAQPLFEWLGEFASRVLVPGGSLLCYIGGINLPNAMNTLNQHLNYCWLNMMLHDQHHLFCSHNKFVRVAGRHVMWFTKGRTRRNRWVVQSVIKSTQDKSLHPWQQGNAVWQWIEPLTDPGDLVIDPFCGSGEWVHLAAAMGRRAIGADLVEGGSVTVAV
jgi:hypothetical protein